jgi:tetratricopeptide (TPR) repeat protein
MSNTALRNQTTPTSIRWLLVASTLVFLVVPYLWQQIVMRETTTLRMANFAAQQQRNSSAIATILGEFRTNLSDMLFIKTERYLHGGVAYMPHIDTDQLAASGTVTHTKTEGEKPETHREEESTTASTEETDLSTSETSHGTHDKHDHEEHEDVATLIRTPENDFRGFLGTLERTVKPWRDPSLPHEHIGGVELLPWYRLATLIDPKNVRAYMIGAWWLKTLREEHALREAVKFLQEGINQNPDAFQLYLMLGYIHRELGDKREALNAFEKAVALLRKQRPANGETGPTWTIYNEEDAIAACSMVVLQRRELYEDDKEGLKAALERLRDLQKDFSNMPSLERLERSLKAQLEAANSAKK